ncbi:MAG TPA: hemolysin family protein [Candidatus Thermoplasmatota archaeon]|nr:hemolysin family protein [Candidatus Thermoplasmatota archaeon]
MLPGVVLAEILVLVGLLGVSAFFSISETSFIGVERLEVRRKAAEGSSRARLVDSMLDNPERILSTVLVGNTIVNVAAAALATVIAEQLFDSWATVIAAVAVTVAILVFCELTPKTLAVQSPLRWSMVTARPLRFVETLLKPFIAVSVWVAKGLARLFGVKAKGEAPYITADEINMLVSMGVESGDVAKFEARVIQELFDFTETDVHNIMTPRDKVHWLPKEAMLSAAAEMAAKEGRTRILVVDGDFDHVLGCVHVRDLLRFTDLQLDRTPVTTALRGVLVAPADLPADRLLVRMQKEHKLLAVIQEADGGNVGICTVEDLMEELVGEIHDEFDAARAGHAHLARGRPASPSPTTAAPTTTPPPPSRPGP